MTITVTERFPSRNAITSDNSTVDIHYLVEGTIDDEEATLAVIATTPSTYRTLVLKSVSVDQIGNSAMYGVAQYGLRKYNETGDSSYSFDTGGGTQHITQAKETMQSLGPGGTTSNVPETMGTIGVNGDNIEGCDITVPTFAFSETHYIDAASVTDAYKSILFNLTGTVNNAAFRNLAAGEGLFLGAAGAKRGEEDWEITYRFAGSPNVTNQTIGSITGVNKKGWEYVWVKYKHGTSANKWVRVPEFVYVERVYDDGDWSTLGIGTT